MKQDYEQGAYESAVRGYKNEPGGRRADAYVVAYAVLNSLLEYSCKTFHQAQAVRRGVERFMADYRAGLFPDVPELRA